MFAVEHKTLDSTDVLNHYVSLDGTPIDSTNVALDIVGGTAQYHPEDSGINGDFGVDGTKIIWDATTFALYSLMDAGDRIRIIYDRS